MRIRDIEVINLHYEYPESERFRYAGGVCTGRLTSLVKVFTDDGPVGLGSVYSHPELVRTIIERQLRPALVGDDPLDIERIRDKAYNLTRWYGRKGAAVSALGGIDIALWDIAGKVNDKPVCALAGRERQEVPAYASGLLWRQSASELAEEAQRHTARGFRAMKMRLGRSEGYDRAALAAVRDAIGPAARLMVDGNARYSLDQARGMIHAFEEASVFWLEEPFAPEDIDSFLELQPDRGSVPLAAGENEFGLQGFRELIDSGAVQIVQPDCCRCGGFTEARRIADRALAHGLQVAPHTWSDAVALAANMHLVASTENSLTVEIDQTGNPFVDGLLAKPLRIHDGMVGMPSGPGLGVEIDEDFVARHAIPRGAPIPPGNYSDMVFL